MSLMWTHYGRAGVELKGIFFEVAFKDAHPAKKPADDSWYTGARKWLGLSLQLD